MVNDEEAILFFKCFKEMLDEAVGFWENGKRGDSAVALADIAIGMDGFAKVIGKSDPDAFSRILQIADGADDIVQSQAKENLYVELGRVLERHAPTD